MHHSNESQCFWIWLTVLPVLLLSINFVLYLLIWPVIHFPIVLNMSQTVVAEVSVVCENTTSRDLCSNNGDPESKRPNIKMTRKTTYNTTFNEKPVICKDCCTSLRYRDIHGSLIAARNCQGASAIETFCSSRKNSQKTFDLRGRLWRKKWWKTKANCPSSGVRSSEGLCGTRVPLQSWICWKAGMTYVATYIYAGWPLPLTACSRCLFSEAVWRFGPVNFWKFHILKSCSFSQCSTWSISLSRDLIMRGFLPFRAIGCFWTTLYSRHFWLCWPARDHWYKTLLSLYPEMLRLFHVSLNPEQIRSGFLSLEKVLSSYTFFGKSST